MHLTGYDPDFFFWQSLLLQARDEFTATFSKSGQQIKFSLYCSTTLLIFCSTPDDIHVEFVVAKHISSLAAVMLFLWTEIGTEPKLLVKCHHRPLGWSSWMECGPLLSIS